MVVRKSIFISIVSKRHTQKLCNIMR